MTRRAPVLSGPLVSIVTRGAIALAILVLAVAMFMTMVATGRSTPQAPVTDLSPQVLVFEAEQVPVARQWVGYGTAQPLVYADVPARLTATVDSVPDDVQAGVPVEQGQVLVRLDASDFQRQLEIAQQSAAELQAQLDQLDVERQRLAEQAEIEERELEIARNELQRVQTLREQNAARSKDVDDARRLVLSAEARHVQTQQAIDAIAPRRAGLEARLEGQRSAVRRAQQDLERTQIRSPISGVLQRVDVKRGESVAAGQSVARVVNLEQIEVPLRLPTLARPNIHVGDSAIVSASEGGESEWAATITRIAPEADPDTRTMTAYVEVQQPKASENYGKPSARPILTPGTFLSGRVESRQAEPRWIVPRRSIRNGRILTVVAGQLRSLPVTAEYGISGTYESFGVPDEQWMVIDAPLRRGDLVLVNVPTELSDGQLVTPVRATAVADAADAAQRPGGEEARP